MNVEIDGSSFPGVLMLPLGACIICGRCPTMLDAHSLAHPLTRPPTHCWPIPALREQKQIAEDIRTKMKAAVTAEDETKIATLWAVKDAALTSTEKEMLETKRTTEAPTPPQT